MGGWKSGKPEGRRAPRDGILVMLSLLHLPASGCQELDGGMEVREALRKIDGAVRARHASHFPDNGFGEGIQTVSGRGHGGSGVWRKKRLQIPTGIRHDVKSLLIWYRYSPRLPVLCVPLTSQVPLPSLGH
jgi:hypothetical protein